MEAVYVEKTGYSARDSFASPILQRERQKPDEKNSIKLSLSIYAVITSFAILSSGRTKSEPDFIERRK